MARRPHEAACANVDLEVKQTRLAFSEALPLIVVRKRLKSFDHREALEIFWRRRCHGATVEGCGKQAVAAIVYQRLAVTTCDSRSALSLNQRAGLRKANRSELFSSGGILASCRGKRP